MIELREFVEEDRGAVSVVRVEMGVSELRRNGRGGGVFIEGGTGNGEEMGEK